jgi:TonB family protein
MLTSIDMENLPLLFLQISAGITLFYLVYLLLLKNETYYRTNRFFLLSGLIIALLIPLLPITYETPVARMDNSAFFSLAEDSAKAAQENAINPQTNGTSFNYTNLFLWVYLIGMFIFLFRLVWQTISISWKIRHSEHRIIDGIKIIDRPTSVPYSYFSVVVIDIQKYSERELSKIIAHEKVHIRERHWVDLLLIELLVVLFWINPVVWLYERAIKQNHEYLADQGVLLAGYSPGQYQALLINQLMGVKVLGFAHNLNFSLNKKRMEMMKKEKSPGVRKMKLLLALPVITLLVFAFAKPEYVPMDASQSTSSNLISNVSETLLVKGFVKTEDGLPLAGAHVILEETTVGTVTDTNGNFEINVPNNGVLVISYIGYETQVVNINSIGNATGLIGVKMKEGVYNIEIREVDATEVDDNVVLGLPYPPPEPIQDKNGETFTLVEEMPHYARVDIYELAVDINREKKAIMQKTDERGLALVGFTITPDGKIVNCHILESSGKQLLDDSAMKIITKLDKWSPGLQHGKPVKVNLSVPVKFE